MELMGFSVWDAKAEAAMTPWFAKTVAMALRMFETECKNPESDFNRHPEDYSLWKTCEFDPSTRTTIGMEPVCVGRAIDFKGGE